MIIDYHMHSLHSVDGKMTVEDACIKAIALGIDEVAFTDHIDLDWPDPDIVFNIKDMDQYMYDIEAARKKFKGEIEIKTGIEIGLQSHVLSHTSHIIKSYPFDFVIASIHIIERMDPYIGKYYEGKSKEESYLRYYEAILDLINQFDDFDVLGHLDYVKRYSPHAYEEGDHMLGFDVVDKILKALIQKGKGIEVNTSGYRHTSQCPMPHFDIVKRYQELGGKILTLGSDAHNTEGIGFGFTFAIEEIKQAGFRCLTTFKRRQPQWIAI